MMPWRCRLAALRRWFAIIGLWPVWVMLVVLAVAARVTRKGG
jgi:hypothetical protein